MHDLHWIVSWYMYMLGSECFTLDVAPEVGWSAFASVGRWYLV